MLAPMPTDLRLTRANSASLQTSAGEELPLRIGRSDLLSLFEGRDASRDHLVAGIHAFNGGKVRRNLADSGDMSPPHPAVSVHYPDKARFASACYRRARQEDG